MATSYRQRRASRELRDFVFRLCTGGGGFVGLYWALQHYQAATRHATPDQCRGHTDRTHQLIAGCIHAISGTVTSDILALLLPILIGLLVGAFVGFLIALPIRAASESR